MLANEFLLLRIALFAAFVPLISRLPIRRLQALVEPAYPANEIKPAHVERIIRYTNFVCRITRPLIAQRCMVRGLTLYYFLRRAGVDVSLVFGIGEVWNKFEGHCWLTRTGKPYLEATDPTTAFTPIYTFNDSLSATKKIVSSASKDGKK